MENLSVGLNSPLKLDPCALMLDLWEKQDRKLALEKPRSANDTVAAEA